MYYEQSRVSQPYSFTAHLGRFLETLLVILTKHTITNLDYIFITIYQGCNRILFIFGIPNTIWQI